MTTVQRRRGSRQIVQPPSSHLKSSVVLSNEIFRNRRRFSLTHFYSDNGPRESWDGPLTRIAKQNLTAFTKVKKVKQTIVPSQSALNQNIADDMILTMKAEIQRRRSLCADDGKYRFFLKYVLFDFIKTVFSFSVRPTSPNRSISPSRFQHHSPKAKMKTRQGGGNRDVIEQMKSLKRTNEDDENGPFDFRTLLKKTDFAPTDSLRIRKGIQQIPDNEIIFNTQVIDL